MAAVVAIKPARGVSAKTEVALYSARLDRTLSLSLLLRGRRSQLCIRLHAGHCQHGKPYIAAWFGSVSAPIVRGISASGVGLWLSVGRTEFELDDHAEAEAVRCWLEAAQ